MTDSYLSLFLARPLWDVWNIFLLALARVVPTIALAPFLGGKILANPIKVGFGIAIVAIMLPYLLLTAGDKPLVMDITFIFLLVKELFLGLLMGFVISVPFFFTQAAGALIDHQRGAQSLQVMNPLTQTQSSPTGTLYNNMMIVTFFFLGGPILFFDALYTSYTLVPVDQFINASFFQGTHPIWSTLIHMMNIIVRISFQLATPSLMAMLMSDLFLGIANRMAPQVQISFLLWSLKAFIGIAVVWAGWWFILKQMDVQAMNWLKSFDKIVQSF